VEGGGCCPEKENDPTPMGRLDDVSPPGPGLVEFTMGKVSMRPKEQEKNEKITKPQTNPQSKWERPYV
jgi:hypothetical protein